MIDERLHFLINIQNLSSYIKEHFGERSRIFEVSSRERNRSY